MGRRVHFMLSLKLNVKAELNSWNIIAKNDYWAQSCDPHYAIFASLISYRSNRHSWHTYPNIHLTIWTFKKFNCKFDIHELVL